MSDEYTEQDRANEGCCWDYVRQLCKGAGCLCNCHATNEEILLSDRATLRREIERERQAFAALTTASTTRINALTARIDSAEHALLKILREAVWESRLTEWRKHGVAAVGSQPTPHEACREIREIARRALRDIGAEAERWDTRNARCAACS